MQSLWVIWYQPRFVHPFVNNKSFPLRLSWKHFLTGAIAPLGDVSEKLCILVSWIRPSNTPLIPILPWPSSLWCLQEANEMSCFLSQGILMSYFPYLLWQIKDNITANLAPFTTIRRTIHCDLVTVNLFMHIFFVV